MLALEPEAASLYIYQLSKLGHFMTNIVTNTQQRMSLEAGAQYMLVDAGGMNHAHIIVHIFDTRPCFIYGTNPSFVCSSIC